MKALSVKNPYALQIMQGVKTIKIRTWSTPYCKRLTIGSSSVPRGGNKPEYLNGHALGEVVLPDVRPLVFEDCEATLLKPEDFEDNKGSNAWVLEDPVEFRCPFPFRGKLHIHDRMTLVIKSTRQTTNRL